MDIPSKIAADLQPYSWILIDPARDADSCPGPTTTWLEAVTGRLPCDETVEQAALHPSSLILWSKRLNDRVTNLSQVAGLCHPIIEKNFWHINLDGAQMTKCEYSNKTSIAITYYVIKIPQHLYQ